MWAAGKGSDDVLRTMLSLKSDIDINMADKYGGTGKNWWTRSIWFQSGDGAVKLVQQYLKIVIPNLMLLDFHLHYSSLGCQDHSKALFPAGIMTRISLCFYLVNEGIWFKTLVASQT